ncbi:MAG: AAA family ATPase [Methylococcales bacterium]|nr:AAA family ATPase [Methylococcales bacterium]
MKIQFENLGCIEQGSVELNDLTIFCGKNNTGKTYVMYTLYGFLARKFPLNFPCESGSWSDRHANRSRFG